MIRTDFATEAEALRLKECWASLAARRGYGVEEAQIELAQERYHKALADVFFTKYVRGAFPGIGVEMRLSVRGWGTH